MLPEKKMNAKEWKQTLNEKTAAQELQTLYGSSVNEGKQRLIELVDMFENTFGSEGDLFLFSAPGRTEIGGNHTDHQHGRVLAASVNLDMTAAVRKREDHLIRIMSEGFDLCEVSTEDLSIRPGEKNSTPALIRGVAAGFAAEGCEISGFDAAVKSSVLPGSGISSSAAFEVLIGNIINSLFFGGKADAVRIAQIGQFAENRYFGKPSGLMDQMACSVGNMLMIDFEDPQNPVVRRLNADFERTGLALCIINTGADHADLTDEYAAIPTELKEVCAFFGKDYLRQIPKEQFWKDLPLVRRKTGDRAILRAIHFYQENERVKLQGKALEAGDFPAFLKLVKESGRSSWMYLQNVVPAGSIEHQEMAAALAVCDELLGEQGAYRVHGGGFAGTIQAFVPKEMLETFRSEVERILGEGSCHILSVRSVGGTQIMAD